MRAVAVALVLGSACGGAAPAPVPPSNASTVESPVESLFGAYRAPHPVMMVCDGGDDGWCEEQVVDALDVGAAGGDSLTVTVELIQTNGHTCSFSGTMAADPAAPPPARGWRFDGKDEGDGPCALTLQHSGDLLILAADGCRYYCGARASLDATFSYPP